MKVPIEISARHIHLSPEDLVVLFGKGYNLKKRNDLSQPGEFAVEETLDLKYGERVLKGVRIIGPVREKTQVELSITDMVGLKLAVNIRDSGKIIGTAGVTLIGPKGEVELTEGVIVAHRHIHINEAEAKEKGLRDGQIVAVKVEGIRSVIFNNVKIRVGKDYNFMLHLDTDEGNAANINKIGEGIICI